MFERGRILEGKYRILGQIGAGGMAVIYEAEHLVIRREVAIKVLHAAALAKPDLIERFEREAQAAGHVESDHVVEVFDFGRLEDGSPFMVMEKLVGETLGDRLRRVRTLTPEALTPLVLQLLTGLEAAHAAGVIHRDLKPSNVFILDEKAGHRDFVKLIDFGISKLLEYSDPEFTSTGVLLGSPTYIAPEQADSSRAADARSDLYSLGVIMYKALAGQPPFDAGSLREVLVKVLMSAPPPLLEVAPSVDAAFAKIVMRTMAREPSHRFQTAGELRAALEAWRAGQPVDFALPAAEVTLTDRLGAAPRRPVGGERAERGERTSTVARSWAATRAERLLVGTKTARAVAAGVAGAVVLFAGAMAVWALTRAPDAPQVTLDAVPAKARTATLDEVATPSSLPLDPEVATVDDLERVGPDAGRARRAAPAGRTAAPGPRPAPEPRAPAQKGIDWGY